VPGLHFVPWHRGSGCQCLGAAAPVTGAAAHEHDLNVVDCDASVTVPRLSSIPVLKWGSGGTPSLCLHWPGSRRRLVCLANLNVKR
jgi:hypothetical protein